MFCDQIMHPAVIYSTFVFNSAWKQMKGLLNKKCLLFTNKSVKKKMMKLMTCATSGYISVYLFMLIFIYKLVILPLVSNIINNIDFRCFIFDH